MTTIRPTAVAHARIRFYTDGHWSASDLALFLQAVEQMHDVVVGHVVSLRWAITNRVSDSRFQLIEALLKPIPIDSFNWNRAAIGGMVHIPARSDWDVYEVKNAVDSRFRSGLQISQIQMASPGFISLQGLGEPLRQLRELIKDFWYRNRQEARRGELAIEAAEMYLNELRKPPESKKGEAPRDVLILAHGLLTLTTLENHEQIKDVTIEDQDGGHERTPGVHQ